MIEHTKVSYYNNPQPKLGATSKETTVTLSPAPLSYPSLQISLENEKQWLLAGKNA